MFIEEKLNQQSEEVKRGPTLRSAVTPTSGRDSDFAWILGRTCGASALRFRAV